MRKLFPASALILIAALVIGPGHYQIAGEARGSHGLPARNEARVDTIMYLVGEAVFPSLEGDLDGDTDYDDVGEFGNDVLEQDNLIYGLRAVTNVPGYRPEACSDRYDSIDSYPLDAPPARGGDGLINTLDLIYTIHRILGTDPSRPRRMSRCITPCTGPVSAPPRYLLQSAGMSSPRAAATATGKAGELQFGTAVADTDGALRVPIYLLGNRELLLAGIGYGLGLRGLKLPLSFVPVSGQEPSVVDNALPGMLAAAWLQPLRIKQGETTLLGYVRIPGLTPEQQASASLDIYGVVADGQDGTSVRLSYPSVGQLASAQ